jgi:type IV pilus assembly protein PilC
MPTFDYAAELEDGSAVQGHLRAASPSAARIQLLERDLVVGEVQQRPPRLRLGKGRVSRIELMHLSRQLAAFLRAGIPILEALELLGEESANPRLREVLGTVAGSVRSGDTLAEAVDAHPDVFPVSYRTMLSSAELTGDLDLVLEQLSTYLERDAAAHQKIRAALTYPTIIAVLSVVTVLIITIFVMPRFKVFFASLGTDLPLPTRLLIGITDGLMATWPVLLGATLVISIGIATAVRTDGGRLLKDRILLRVPVLGEIIRYSAVERFCRILSSMLVAGVPMSDAMSVASTGVGSTVYEAALLEARDRILEGQGIARPLAATGVFPAAATQMIRVGESTGSLDQQLVSAARFYERELDYKVKRFTDLIEPVVIVGMGLVVGFVAVALISAMYGVFQGGTL